MKYLGSVTDSKDIATKEYVDNKVAQSGGGGVTLETVINAIYPVGSLYISFNSTDPSTLFGGTWEQIKDRFLLAAGDTYEAGAEGGSADAVAVSHTHTQASHDHSPSGGSNYGFAIYESGSGIGRVKVNTSSGTRYGFVGKTGAASADDSGLLWYKKTSDATPAINSSGEDGTGKNMPPYLSVYMWKRTS